MDMIDFIGTATVEELPTFEEAWETAVGAVKALLEAPAIDGKPAIGLRAQAVQEIELAGKTGYSVDLSMTVRSLEGVEDAIDTVLKALLAMTLRLDVARQTLDVKGENSEERTWLVDIEITTAPPGAKPWVW